MDHLQNNKTVRDHVKKLALNLHAVLYNGVNIVLKRIFFFFFYTERVKSYLFTIRFYFKQSFIFAHSLFAGVI